MDLCDPYTHHKQGMRSGVVDIKDEIKVRKRAVGSWKRANVGSMAIMFV